MGVPADKFFRNIEKYITHLKCTLLLIYITQKKYIEQKISKLFFYMRRIITLYSIDDLIQLFD